jgi:hypothetical protein
MAMRKTQKQPAKPETAKAQTSKAMARCACGKVVLEIDMPAVWAWHDHSAASQRAQGCAYATYVGSWKSRFRVLRGAKNIRHYEEPETRNTRSFCGTCGTPLFNVRARSPKMVNIPRALFESRTGREPRYHVSLEQSPEWSYKGERLSPLKGYPGVLWNRGRKTKGEIF